MLTDEEKDALFYAASSMNLIPVVESIITAREQAARAQALEDAATWYETPVVADNYPGFGEVLRANAAQLRANPKPSS